MDATALVAIVVLSVVGFLIASYIHSKNTRGETLVCPIGSDCTKVVTGEYSTVFGVPIVVTGMFYYSFNIAIYCAVIAFAPLQASIFTLMLALVATGSFIFSLYLTFVQAVIIRKWCTWCLGSAIITIFIFCLAISRIDFDVVALIRQWI